MSTSSALPRHLQLLWGREQPGRRGPKPRATIREIGAAAIRVADIAGLDAVSMKAVAGELGMTTMSLYRYVDAKEQLYEVMVDGAYGEPGGAAEDHWRARIEWWARSLAAVCVEHPWLVTVPLASPPSTPNALAWTDAGLRAFEGTPLPVADRLSSLLVLDGYVRSHVRMSLQFGLLGGGAPPGDGVPYVIGVAPMLTGERYRALLGALPALADDGADFYSEELDFGLSVVLDGIAARIAESAG